MLPYLQIDPGVGRLQAPFDCPSCMSGTAPVPVGQRAYQHCGWMDPAEWPAWLPGQEGLPRAFGAEPYTLDVCPGWLVRQPAVIVGAEAAMALREHCLPVFDPLGLNAIWELASEGMRSMNMYQDWRAKETAPKNAPLPRED